MAASKLFSFWYINNNNGIFIQRQPSRGVPIKKLFWKYATNLQENIHAEVRIQ